MLLFDTTYLASGFTMESNADFLKRMERVMKTGLGLDPNPQPEEVPEEAPEESKPESEAPAEKDEEEEATLEPEPEKKARSFAHPRCRCDPGG